MYIEIEIQQASKAKDKYIETVQLETGWQISQNSNTHGTRRQNQRSAVQTSVSLFDGLYPKSSLIPRS